MTNLEDYISCVVDATVKSGIQRQVEAFRLGFDQVTLSDITTLFSEGKCSARPKDF